MDHGIDGARPLAYLMEEILDLGLLADIASRIENSRKAGSNLGESVATTRAYKEIMAVARKRSREGRSKARTRARDNDRLPIDHYYPRSFSISDRLPQKLMPQPTLRRDIRFRAVGQENSSGGVLRDKHAIESDRRRFPDWGRSRRYNRLNNARKQAC
jgi:hypothetical protein